MATILFYAKQDLLIYYMYISNAFILTHKQRKLVI